MNITNNTPKSNNIENARSSNALNYSKLTTQIFCISFLIIIFTLFYASNSLANSGRDNYNNSSVNSVNGKISHKCANELSNERVFNNDIVMKV